MTDDRMDVRLRAAGERWRDAHTDSAPAVTARSVPPRRPWLLLASAAVVVAALVAGGVTLFAGGDERQTGKPHRTAGTIGTGTWHARSVLPVARNGNRPPDHDEPLASAAFLRFRGGAFVGSDGCNSISGKATLHRATITFGAVASTEIACSAGTMATASVMVAVLSGTARYSVTSSALTIAKPGVGTVFLSRAAARPQPTTPVGAWMFTGIQTTHDDGDSGVGSGSGVSISPTRDGTRLVLDSAGTFTVNLCPRLRGKFAVRGDQLILREVEHLNGPTCGSASAALTNQLTVVLDGKTSWNVDGNQLTITKSGRSVIFQRSR